MTPEKVHQLAFRGYKAGRSDAFRDVLLDIPKCNKLNIEPTEEEFIALEKMSRIDVARATANTMARVFTRRINDAIEINNKWQLDEKSTKEAIALIKQFEGL